MAGVWLTGERLLMGVATGWLGHLALIILGAITAFATAAELLGSTRLPAGWATAVGSLALSVISVDVTGPAPGVGKLLALGGMAVAAGVSAACAIRLGNRLRFPVVAVSSTILGGGLLAFGAIWAIPWSTNVDDFVILSSLGCAIGLLTGVGVLLWQAICGRRLPRSSSERVSPTAT